MNLPDNQHRNNNNINPWIPVSERGEREYILNPLLWISPTRIKKWSKRKQQKNKWGENHNVNYNSTLCNLPETKWSKKGYYITLRPNYSANDENVTFNKTSKNTKTSKSSKCTKQKINKSDKSEKWKMCQTMKCVKKGGVCHFKG